MAEQQFSTRRRQHTVATCPLCGRDTTLTFHHLIPKKLHRRPRYRKHFSRQQLNQGIYICRQCHDGIHSLYDEATLATRFASREALLHDAKLARHYHWVGRQRVR